MAAATVLAELLTIGRGHIDAQLLALEAKHRFLRQERNSFTYVGRLPKEILCAIFQICIDDTRKHRKDAPAANWYSFTHVCTNWRATAIHDPALWNHITFDQPLWVQEMMRRSQNLPLSINLNPSVYTQSSANIIDHTLQQCHRFSYLHLAASKHATINHLINQLIGPFRAMRSLTICVRYQDVPIVNIPDIFCDSNFPVLEMLYLVGCGLNWSGGLPSSLISLSVSYDSSLSQSALPHMHQVLNMLRSTPRLLTLILLWSLPIDNEDGEPRGDEQYIVLPLELKKLVYLRIIDKAPALSSFLSGLRFPYSTRVHIGCETSSEVAVRNFGAALRRCNLVTKTREIASLVIDQVSSEHLHFIARCYNDDIRVDVTWTHWGELTGESALSGICRVFDLSELTVLYVVDLGLVDYEVWLSTFSSARLLRTLCVSGEPTHGLLQALHKGPVEPTVSPFLPRLLTLILERVEFERGAIKELLFQSLTTRLDQDMGLHTVIIRGSSGFCVDDLIDLQMLAPQSSWDGQTAVENVSSEDELDDTTDGEHEESNDYGSEYSSLEDYDYRD